MFGIKFKFSEKDARAFQESHTKRLETMSKNLPPEFTAFNAKLKILNENSWGVHHLFKRAFTDKKYTEAFLYFFYSFELTMKHLIMTEMMIINQIKFLKNPKEMFSTYSSAEIHEIQEIGLVGTIIEKFCELHGEDIKSTLRIINTERNFIIHNMMKKQLSEKQIEGSFKDFFQKTEIARKKFYAFVDKTLAERPQKIFSKVEELSKNTPAK